MTYIDHEKSSENLTANKWKDWLDWWTLNLWCHTEKETIEFSATLFPRREKEMSCPARGTYTKKSPRLAGLVPSYGVLLGLLQALQMKQQVTG